GSKRDWSSDVCSSDLLGDGDGLDHDRVDRAVHAVGGGGGDRVDDLLGLRVNDLTEDGVAVVQVRGRAHGDEELGAVGARAGVGQGRKSVGEGMGGGGG